MKLIIEITQDYLGSIERGVEIECETPFELEQILGGIQRLFLVIQ